MNLVERSKADAGEGRRPCAERFVARDVADLLDARSRRISVYLYDNAADPKGPHIRTRQVKALSRLDFVRGIKVSASKKT